MKQIFNTTCRDVSLVANILGRVDLIVTWLFLSKSGLHFKHFCGPFICGPFIYASIPPSSMTTKNLHL